MKWPVAFIFRDCADDHNVVTRKIQDNQTTLSLTLLLLTPPSCLLLGQL